jgi:tetratricopeptide (TPR) repeat protein
MIFSAAPGLVPSASRRRGLGVFALAACAFVRLMSHASPGLADDGDYGPDWPLCQNLDADPRAEIAACGRLIAGGKLTPQHLSWAHNDVGTALLDLRRPDLAEAEFRKAIEADAGNFAPYFNLTSIMLDTGRFQEALDLSDKGLALNPRAPRGLLRNRGWALESLGRFDEAFESYRAELAKTPDDDRTLYLVVKLAERTDRPQDAMQALNAAIAFNPLNAESFHRRGNIFYFDFKQPDAALADFNEAIRLNPREVGAMRARAILYTAAGKYQEALADLDTVIAITPSDPDPFYNRAQVYLAMGDFKRAMADCQRNLDLQPQGASTLFLQWRISVMAGDYEAAVAQADSVIALGVTPYRLNRGAAEYASGATLRAAADFERLTQQFPEIPYGWLWLYLADRKLGRDDSDKIRPVAARRDAWPNIVLRHIVGAATAEQVLAAADVPDPAIRQQRLAEANFYLAELADLGGDTARANTLFEAALATGYVRVRSHTSPPLYKDDDAVEIAMAYAALHPKGGL